MSRVAGLETNGDNPYTPGYIAVPCQDHWRFTRSLIDLVGVQRPIGTKVGVMLGMDVTLSLNETIKDALADETFQWVWFQSDDHLYPDDALIRMLDRNVDVCVPMISKRSPAYEFVIYKGEGTELTDDGILMPNYDHFQLNEIPTKGLLRVHAAGSGGMLVRRRVLEAIPSPWFESSTGAYVNDDLEFCRKVRDAGFEIYCDVEVCFGHLSTYVVRPETRDDRWGIALDFGNGAAKTNIIWLGDDVRKIAEEQDRLKKEATLA